MSITLIVATLSIVFSARVSALNNATDYLVYRIIPADRSQLQWLKNLHDQDKYDFWLSPSHVANPVDVMVNFQEAGHLKKLFQEKHLNHSVFIQSVRDKIVAEQMQNRQSNSRLSKYHPVTGIHGYIDDLAKEYPQLASIETIGKSGEGRNINIIKLTSRSSRQAQKPIFWLDAGIHAREWITPATALYIADRLARNYNSNDPKKSTRRLLDKFEWHIAPTINPDGYDWTHQKSSSFFVDNRMWRKNRNPNNGRSRLCSGVDLNRNFASQWGEKGASNNPCAETYHGASAASEKETQAVQKHLTDNKSRVKAFLSLHSYGQYIFHPWGYTDKAPKDIKQHLDVGSKMKQAIYNVHKTDYTLGSAAKLLYVTSGDSGDYAYEQGIVHSYIMELRDKGNHGFLLPPDQITPTAEEVYAGVEAMAHGVEETMKL